MTPAEARKEVIRRDVHHTGWRPFSDCPCQSCVLYRRLLSKPAKRLAWETIGVLRLLPAARKSKARGRRKGGRRGK